MRFDQKMALNAFMALATMGILNGVAIKMGLYWIFPSFDIPMHFLGGLAFGFIATWVAFRWRLLGSGYSSYRYLGLVGAVVLVAGVSWELFELLVDQIRHSAFQRGTIDTVLDVLMGLLGGYVVALGVLVRWPQIVRSYVSEYEKD